MRTGWLLHAYHRRDLLGLGQVLRAGVGYPEVADQTGVAQFGQRAEVPGDRVPPGQAQVHQFQAVAAELAQVLLDLPAQLGRGGLGQPAVSMWFTPSSTAVRSTAIAWSRSPGIAQGANAGPRWSLP